MKKNKNITSLSEVIDTKYGLRGSESREIFEEEYQAFKLGVLIERARKQRGLTQSELAEKCGTNKSYISRVENDASDIRLSTLLRIIHKGLGGRLSLELE